MHEAVNSSGDVTCPNLLCIIKKYPTRIIYIDNLDLMDPIFLIKFSETIETQRQKMIWISLIYRKCCKVIMWIHLRVFPIVMKNQENVRTCEPGSRTNQISFGTVFYLSFLIWLLRQLIIIRQFIANIVQCVNKYFWNHADPKI